MPFHTRNRAALRKEFGIEQVYTGWHLDLLRMALRQRRRLEWVDWKEAPEEVLSSLCGLLPQGASEQLPSCGDAEAEPAEVLRDCNAVLRDLYGLTALLWDTGGDECVFMVVPSAKIPETFALASQLDIALRHIEKPFL